MSERPTQGQYIWATRDLHSVEIPGHPSVRICRAGDTLITRSVSDPGVVVRRVSAVKGTLVGQPFTIGHDDYSVTPIEKEQAR